MYRTARQRGAARDLRAHDPLDHLIRTQQDRRREHDPERLRRAEVEGQGELGRLRDRDVGGLRALEDLVDDLGGRPPMPDDRRCSES